MTDDNTTTPGITRRKLVKTSGAVGLAAMAGFPMPGVARADNRSLKIGYIGCMSGPRV